MNLSIYQNENPIFCIKSTWKLESYQKGQYVYQAKEGVLRNRFIFAAAFALAFVVILTLTSGHRNFSTTLPHICGMFLCGLSVIYFLIGLPMLVKRQSQIDFESNALMDLPFKFSIMKDGFVLENKYERQLGHWADISVLVETKTDYILIFRPMGEIFTLAKCDILEVDRDKLKQFLIKRLDKRYKNKA